MSVANRYAGFQMLSTPDAGMNSAGTQDKQ
jgi:hypothetical protein